MADVAAYLASAGKTPFSYGAHDCCLWLADWLVALGRDDPAEDLRGRYRTELGCKRLLNKRGGVLGAVTACAVRAGLKPTKFPIVGDVGVVRVKTFKGDAIAGALCTGRRWAVLAPGGLIVGEMTPLAAWRV